MLNPAIQSVIEKAVIGTLAPMAVTSVSVEEGEDHDANDVLFVTVNLPSASGPIPGDRMLSAMAAASEAMLKLGDERPPYLRTQREGEVAPDDGADIPN